MELSLANITLNEEEQIKEQWPSEGFAAANRIFEIFNKNYSNYAIPSEYIPIYKTLFLMTYQIDY